MEQVLGQTEGVNAYGARDYMVSFAPNGSSDPTALHGYGVTSVKYASGSIWKIQLDDSNFTRILAWGGKFQAAAAGSGLGCDVELDATNTNLATGVIAFASLNTSRARADVTGDANCVVSVWFKLSKHPLDT